MILLNSFRDLKLGQKVAWKVNLNLGKKWEGIIDEELEWICISQVKGFYKKTTYPIRRDCSQYTTTNRVVFDVLVRNKGQNVINSFFLDMRNNEIDSAYSYDMTLLNAFLLENEKDCIEVLKSMIADNL